jgi:hypothetical protein
MAKALVAQQGNMKEFDPECELHYPILIVKMVDPGCTFELQLEFPRSGTILRITSTESPEEDETRFLEAVKGAFEEAMMGFNRERRMDNV